MVSDRIQEELNKQILLEAESSQTYLAMASWAEGEGLSGTVNFLYKHSDEERGHMLKLIRYVNDRGGKAKIPALPEPVSKYQSISQMFQTLLENEMEVTISINHLVSLCLEEKDYTTHNFLQWYVAEQIEEETLAKMIMDKLKLLGDDKSGLYLFDRDIESLPIAKTNSGLN